MYPERVLRSYYPVPPNERGRESAARRGNGVRTYDPLTTPVTLRRAATKGLACPERSRRERSDEGPRLPHRTESGASVLRDGHHLIREMTETRSEGLYAPDNQRPRYFIEARQLSSGKALQRFGKAVGLVVACSCVSTSMVLWAFSDS